MTAINSALNLQNQIQLCPIANIKNALIIAIALHALQKMPKAEGLGWDTAVWGGKKIWELMKSDASKGAVQSISDFVTFKTIFNKLVDANLLTYPQFAIPFRVIMTAAMLYGENKVCRSADEMYGHCVERQTKIIEECTEKRMDYTRQALMLFQEFFDIGISLNDQCTMISDPKGKEICYASVSDNYNEFMSQAKDTMKIPDEFHDKCVSGVPSCTVPWLERNVACGTYYGTFGISAGRLFWELYSNK